MRVRLGVLAAVLFCLVSATAAEKHVMTAAKGDDCVVCGMYIEVFKKTAAEVVYLDGKRELFCGVACAIRRINEVGGLELVKEAWVTDWDTGELIDLKTADYVIGSKIVPDMVPNIIPFKSQSAADTFRQANGGKNISLEAALVTTSYVGMTLPFRIPQAALPAKGQFSAAIGSNFRVMSNILEGGESRGIGDILAKQATTPVRMRGETRVLQMQYALTDNHLITVAVPYVVREFTMMKQNGDVVQKRNEGFGDTEAYLRWRLYHDDYYDKHFTVLLGTTIPTGEYNVKLTPATIQSGQSASSLSGGLLYSQHIKKFWVHGSVLYRYNFENSDKYQYGSAISPGIAVHYTPNTKTMLGVEIDGQFCSRDQQSGVDIANTGRTAFYASLVGQQRLANFWGGNFDLRAIFGVPIYEHVNKVQLGETYHAGVFFTWKRRFI